MNITITFKTCQIKLQNTLQLSKNVVRLVMEKENKKLLKAKQTITKERLEKKNSLGLAVQFAMTDEYTIVEIMKEFSIPDTQKMTLRRRLKESKVIMKESRGRKKIVF